VWPAARADPQTRANSATETNIQPDPRVGLADINAGLATLLFMRLSFAIFRNSPGRRPCPIAKFSRRAMRRAEPIPAEGKFAGVADAVQWGVDPMRSSKDQAPSTKETSSSKH